MPKHQSTFQFNISSIRAADIQLYINQAKKSMFNLYFNRGVLSLHLYQALLDVLLSYEKLVVPLNIYLSLKHLTLGFFKLKSFERTLNVLKLILASVFITDGLEVL